MKVRDDFLLKAFNQNGWKCKKCVMDPCMFFITREGKRTWLLAFVDDIDCVSECKEHQEMIYKIMNEEWSCKEVSPSFMLGVKRELTEHAGVRKMEMTMESLTKPTFQ